MLHIPLCESCNTTEDATCCRPAGSCRYALWGMHFKGGSVSYMDESVDPAVVRREEPGPGVYWAAVIAVSNVGERITTARRRRGLPRRTVAELVGRSEEWLRLIETGQRQLDSIEHAIRLADVLHMPSLPAELGIGARERSRPGAGPAMLTPIRDALMDPGAPPMRATTRRTSWDAQATLERATAEGWDQWLGGTNRYTGTFQMMPALIRGAAASTLAPDGATGLASALAAYHLAAAALSAVDERGLAWLAADRAVCAAGRDGTPEQMAAAAWHLIACFLRQKCWAAASRLSTEAIAWLPAPDGGQVAALRGALLLTGAEASAGMADQHQAEQLLAEAQRIARDLEPRDWPDRVPFGAVEAGICAVQIAIELGRPGEAIRLAGQLKVPDDYPPGLQVRHFIKLAALHARRNEDIPAVFALTKVAEISPEDLRYHPDARHVLHRMLRRGNQMVHRELAYLANLADITVSAWS